MSRTYLLVFSCLLAFAGFAQEPQRQAEVIEVTATKIAEDVTLVPQSITIVDGDEIRARGAVDLPSALQLAAGVSIHAGGDAGPAGSVPEMWGLREADAFLLVVDGVPWGGAFNPDLPALDLTNVDRIEVVRGAAPVMYGATSFTGVIHVIHRDPGAPGYARAAVGSHSSGSVSVTLPITQRESLRQSITANYEKRGFRDERTDFDRMHLLYRAATAMAGGTLHFDFDVLNLGQSPASPHPREGRVLSPRVPLDANHNPRGAKMDQTRLHAVAGFETKGPLPWTTTLALTHSDFDILRGFLTTTGAASPNATGFEQERRVTDLYFDSHVVTQLTPSARLIAGVDHLYGRGKAESGLFDYFIPLDGANPPSTEPDEETSIDVRRNFSGLYAQTEWSLGPRLRVDAGARLNHTSERREAGEEEEELESEEQTATRLSGGIGATWQAFGGEPGRLALFANYRNTFKPAAFDFGPEAGEAELLDPETGRSYEIGAKGRMRRAIEWEASLFRNDLENLLVSTVRNGLPARENGGSIRVDGGEFELRAKLPAAFHADVSYAYHDARFRDFVQAFGGVPTQLAGRRFEMSPLHLFGAGLRYTPPAGLTAHVEMNYTGARYLTKRNTAMAPSFTAWSAGAGYRFGRGELRVDGRNLTDERPPVAESELGDAQYYRMPARSIEVSYATSF
jgi:iron complex outermembrane receptor protein